MTGFAFGKVTLAIAQTIGRMEAKSQLVERKPLFRRVMATVQSNRA